MHYAGEPIRGHGHSTDASSTPLVPTLYNAGSNDARTLAANEYIEIHHMTIVAAPGGDVRVFFDTDDDNALDSAEDIFRGTVGTNGGVEQTFCPPRVGQVGVLPHVLCPAGVVDFTFQGTIRRAETTGRPSWREALKGG